jgi:C4-dicarboxylate-specific signal transduction histidine kinase
VSIRTVISDALSLCSEKFKYNQIRLTVDCIHDHNFNGRQSQIAQILTNLLNNSFDAVKDLTNKWVKISVTTTESQLKIEVIDSGKGITPNIQAKLMQPFFTTKEVGKGTGLGLSISRKIAEEHGGELFFDTKAAHTSFVLFLPLPKP